MEGESSAWLAGGPDGADRLARLIPVALRALAAGTAERGGPIPSGGPAAVAALATVGSAGVDRAGVAGDFSSSGSAHASDLSAPDPSPARDFSPPGSGLDSPVPGGTQPSLADDGRRTRPEHPENAAPPSGLPWQGVGAERALEELGTLLAAGAADPAEPACAAHLHCPPLAVAVAADVVASALNPSMDSWDQAPVASELERQFTTGIARLCYPRDERPDAVVTSGGTESNLLGLLLARETTGDALRPVCGANSHHSVARAAWLLGLPAPVVVSCVDDRMVPSALAEVLGTLGARAVVVATAGTTNTGRIDPLPEIAQICRRAGARLHVDAAYGGLALCSPALRGRVAGLELADSVALDLHKFGWQPVAAGLFAAREATDLRALTVRAEYLNADDDTEAGLPDLLGRSLHTSRRPDAFRMAVTVRALGVQGLGELVERCCANASALHELVQAHPDLRSWGPPELSTVVFRPKVADELPGAAGDELVARVRRTLMEEGTAVIGRGVLPTGGDGSPQRWLKLTLLHPHATEADYRPLLDAVAAVAAKSVVTQESPVAS
ncbi:pyridoxal phosphate-dependent decarboxylase family protein [Amycolatopsis panacis]|uniref:Aminotransferase class V-fold PLP-dependent enzyme n=1 Tax=Amycolatopsis panacis TaxID=2340917 RepID=A0A419HZ53_9PSEU|nr:aminotransferase class V-fold PLP-dependent enzyme [Amycolatopsis panacis]RJQ82414.1 aminotransferase class V-fold PLP-dependent enzyme [Amycolatopsis panacis]